VPAKSDCGITSNVLVRFIALAHPTFAARSRAVRCRLYNPEGVQSGRSPGCRSRSVRQTIPPIRL